MHVENKKSAWVSCFVFLRCFSMHYNCFCYMLELVCKWVDRMGERPDLMSDLMDGRCRYWCLALSVLRWWSNLECIFSQNTALTTKWLNEKLTVSHGILGKLKRELKLQLLCTNPILVCSSGCLDMVQVCPSENSEWEWTEIKAFTLRGIMRSRGGLRHLTYFSHAQPQKLYQRNASEHFTVIQGYIFLVC